MRESYYKILDVDKNATDDQIKSAYRGKVKRLHPDRYHGNSAPFRAVQEAYEVLCDPVRRQRHDDELAQAQRLHRTAPTGEPLSRRRYPPAEPLVPKGRSADPRGLFYEVPRADNLRRTIEQPSDVSLHPQGEPPEEIHVQVSLRPEQALRGGNIRLLVPLELMCPVCHGQGGSWFFECHRCYGKGVFAAEYPLELVFPARVTDGSSETVSLKRPGMADLLVTLHLKVHRW